MYINLSPVVLLFRSLITIILYLEGTPDSQDGMENSNDAGYGTTADGDDTTNDEPAAAPIARCGVCEIPLKKPTSHYGGNGSYSNDVKQIYPITII